MLDKQWQEFYPEFSPIENWGDAEKMDYRLVWMLHRARKSLGRKFFINRGVDSEGSNVHKSGLAVDFRVEGIKDIMIEKSCLINAYGTTGKVYRLSKANDPAIFDLVNFLGSCRLGFYPFWEYNGNIWGGFHADVDFPLLNWWRDESGKYHYNFRV